MVLCPSCATARPRPSSTAARTTISTRRFTTSARGSDAGEEVSGAKALDAAIELFSGRSIDDLAKRDGREKAKKALVSEVSELYGHKVFDIYFTDFVMQ